jgi:hypothetical protein
MARSPYMTVPNPMANIGSILASVLALTHNVNLLIVNAQANDQSPNLTGATSFAKTTTLDTRLTNIENQIVDIKTILTKHGLS